MKQQNLFFFSAPVFLTTVKQISTGRKHKILVLEPSNGSFDNSSCTKEVALPQ